MNQTGVEEIKTRQTKRDLIKGLALGLISVMMIVVIYFFQRR
jgi:hypothetical protein